MFTGLIEEWGTVDTIDRKGMEGARIHIKASKVKEDLHVGDSIAINGICLTATTKTNHGFTADVMPETLRNTGLVHLKAGDRVNLERAMAANGRFGGHIVTGHIDGVGRILKRYTEGNALVFKVAAPKEVLRCTVEKGSIAVDGISLTVAFLDKDSFTVSIIPHTAAETTLGYKGIGDLVNLESDYISKVVDKLLKERSSGSLMDMLTENGF